MKRYGFVCFLLMCWACQPLAPIPGQEQGFQQEPTTQADAGAPPDTQGGIADQAPPRREPPDQKAAPEASGPENAVKEKAPSGTWRSPATPYKGKATWYEADGSGNCSFPKKSGKVLVAAMNNTQYGSADLCGACVEVKGPKGTVRVQVTDRCPECPSNHLDLSQAAFSQIADLKTGVIEIQWQLVPCQDTAPMQYFYKDGSSQWWTAIQVRRHRLPISKLEAFKGGKWTSLKRERYNFFLDAGGLGKDSVRLRIHAMNGETREETIPAPASSTLVTGKKQF